MNIVVIIVTYNRCGLLEQVLSSLKAQSLRPNKVIVIDNNSSDNTYEVVNKYVGEGDLFIYHNTKGNLGGAGGFHRGFEIARQYTYDYLWLMDDDFLPEQNCLEFLVEERLEGIVQPIRHNQDDSCAEMSPVVYDLNKIFCRNPKLYSVADIYETLGEVDLIDIATVPFEGPLISRTVVDAIGFPNPDFFITGDDTDYSIRAARFGFPIKCSLKAKATRLLIHDQDTDLFTWKGYFILRNHFYILREYGTNMFVRNRPLVILSYFVLKALLRKDFSSVKKAFSAYFDSFTLANNDKYKP